MDVDPPSAGSASVSGSDSNDGTPELLEDDLDDLLPDEGGNVAQIAHVQDGDTQEDANEDNGEDESDEADEADEDTMEGLTISEREILTLLAVDKVDHSYWSQYRLS